MPECPVCLSMCFAVEGQTRHLTCRFENFYQGKPFSCDIVLSQPPMESMVIAMPWDEKHAFYYNQKINSMRASGWMEYDGKRYEFNPATDFGTLDWGRGVWTYDNTWYWGSGNADIDGNAFDFNPAFSAIRTVVGVTKQERFKKERKKKPWEKEY